jgi:hypothetical protein
MSAPQLARLSAATFVASLAILGLSGLGWHNFQTNLARTFVHPNPMTECLYSLSARCAFSHKVTGMFGGDYYDPITAFIGLGLLGVGLGLAIVAWRAKSRAAPASMPAQETLR